MTDWNNQLLKAATEGDLNLVIQALDNGANIDCDDEYRYEEITALVISAEAGHLDIVKYLVSQGADIIFNDSEALQWASEYNQIEIVNFLIEAHIKRKEDITKLPGLIQKKHHPLLKKILLKQKQSKHVQAVQYDEIGL